jgi:hypothetical protein
MRESIRTTQEALVGRKDIGIDWSEYGRMGLWNIGIMLELSRSCNNAMR